MTQPSGSTRPTSLTAEDVERLLPHRYPFALIDRVTEVVPGERATAVKNISVADGLLAGHFPGRMIYPGVLMVECVAQLAAVVYGTEAALAGSGSVVDEVSDRVGYLAEIKQAKFLGLVTPGDQLIIQVRSGTRRGDLISVTGQATVGSRQVLTAKLTVTQQSAPA